jgi:hypothetical protein
MEEFFSPNKCKDLENEPEWEGFLANHRSLCTALLRYVEIRVIRGLQRLNDGGMQRETLTFTGANKFCGLCLAPVTGNFNFSRHVLLCHGADYNQEDCGGEMEWMNRRLTLPQ